MLVDSHCHLNDLNLTQHHDNLSNAIQAAKDNGVEYLLNVCIDLEHFPAVLNIAEYYSHVFASVGLHPNEKVEHEPTEEQLSKLANHPKIIAIGETGLDYFRSEGDLTWQQNRFRHHIRAAKKTGRAIIVHSRDAEDDTIHILKEEKADEVGGVLHCFTGTLQMAKQALDFGFYISLSGIVTFKNATQLQEIAKYIPLDRLLVETDSPYLAPIPHRGKPNEPAYVKFVAEFLAQLRHEPFELISEKTTENFFKLFRLATR